MTYASTKTYGHEVGLSCAFRQWRAKHSHCRYLHGYAVSIRLEFEADDLDARNWVVDFGGLKDLKQRLEATFDHKTVVAHDDPAMDWFHRGHEMGLLDLVILDDVGCERFAEHVYRLAQAWLEAAGYVPRCRISMVEVREHGANSAIYRP
jgi:6-pyruvoyltetrahydropterin/6-carboxytetrahydropterin synthase